MWAPGIRASLPHCWDWMTQRRVHIVFCHTSHIIFHLSIHLGRHLSVLLTCQLSVAGTRPFKLAPHNAGRASEAVKQRCPQGCSCTCNAEGAVRCCGGSAQHTARRSECCDAVFLLSLCLCLRLIQLCWQWDACVSSPAWPSSHMKRNWRAILCPSQMSCMFFMQTAVTIHGQQCLFTYKRQQLG